MLVLVLVQADEVEEEIHQEGGVDFDHLAKWFQHREARSSSAPPEYPRAPSCMA